jgi:acetylglutamate kinase
MKTLNIIKIGGNVIDSEEDLKNFLEKFSALEGLKILVHGGGNLATELGSKLKIPTKMIEGRRITDKATLEIVTMVYAGLINKNIVAKLQANACNAIGLCGADANCIPSQKRNSEGIDYGFVGDVDAKKIEFSQISKLLDQGLVPVFCAITHDGKGNLLNTNADTIAAELSVAMASKFNVILTY